MKRLVIVDQATWEAAVADHCSGAGFLGNSHFLTLADGRILAAVDQDKPLPDGFEKLPLCADPTPLESKHVKDLSEFGVASGDTAIKAMQKVSVHHPLFSP